MAWYGRDYGERGWGGQSPREDTWGGRYNPRDTGWGRARSPEETRWGRGQPDTGWGGGRNQQSGGWSEPGRQGAGYRGPIGPRERMTFSPREEYDRDMRSQLREGWHDLKRGVRRAFGGGEYDTGYRAGSYGQGRSERDRFEQDRFDEDRLGAGRFGGEGGWRGRGRESQRWESEGRGGAWPTSDRGYRTGRNRGLDPNRYW